MSENPPADSTYGLAEKYLRAMRHAADLLDRPSTSTPLSVT